MTVPEICAALGLVDGPPVSVAALVEFTHLLAAVGQPPTHAVPGLLAQPAPPAGPPESVRALMLRVTGIDIERCPVCQQGVLRQLEVLRPAPLVWDTS